MAKFIGIWGMNILRQTIIKPMAHKPLSLSKNIAQKTFFAGSLKRFFSRYIL